jgi:predicted ATPase
MEDEGMRTRLLSDLRDAVPYIQRVVPERILGLPTLKFIEQDSKLTLRAKQMSDGTIRLLGLLAVIRQPVPPPVVVIEEPENALHWFAIKMFLQIAKEASQTSRFPSQIFLTSHSSTVVDDVLSLESQKRFHSKGFVSKRVNGSGTIQEAPSRVLKAIAENLGRPSEFLREGSFEDEPVQLTLIK